MHDLYIYIGVAQKATLPLNLNNRAAAHTIGHCSGNQQ
jgi:hypothetical protein